MSADSSSYFLSHPPGLTVNRPHCGAFVASRGKITSLWSVVWLKSAQRQNNSSKKGFFYKSEDSIEWCIYFWWILFYRQMPLAHTCVSLISQEEETPPSQHMWGVFLAGPPPKDGREWIIVEGCSLWSSYISFCHKHWVAHILSLLHPNDLRVGWHTRSTLDLCSFCFHWNLVFKSSRQLPSRTTVSDDFRCVSFNLKILQMLAYVQIQLLWVILSQILYIYIL